MLNTNNFKLCISSFELSLFFDSNSNTCPACGTYFNSVCGNEGAETSLLLILMSHQFPLLTVYVPILTHANIFFSLSLPVSSAYFVRARFDWYWFLLMVPVHVEEDTEGQRVTRIAERTNR